MEDWSRCAHLDVLPYGLIVTVFDPVLDVPERDEEAEVGAERVVVLLGLELVRHAIFRDDMDVDVSAGG
jgi:hypothetical protein